MNSIEKTLRVALDAKQKENKRLKNRMLLLESEREDLMRAVKWSRNIIPNFQISGGPFKDGVVKYMGFTERFDERVKTREEMEQDGFYDDISSL